MGLDNIPVLPEGKKNAEIPQGLTHKPEDPCPFDSLEQPLGIFGTCCWLRGKAAARELHALGRDALSDRMHADMTPDEARAFGAELKAAADTLAQQYAKTTKKPRGAGWNGVWDPKTKETVWGKYSTFDEALDEIRTAARWYEEVACLGYGVHAWY